MLLKETLQTTWRITQDRFGFLTAILDSQGSKIVVTLEADNDKNRLGISIDSVHVGTYSEKISKRDFSSFVKEGIKNFKRGNWKGLDNSNLSSLQNALLK